MKKGLVHYSLSRACVVLFAVCLLVVDILTPGVLSQFREFLSLRDLYSAIAFVYVLSVPLWAILFSLWRLVSSIAKGKVFTEDNVRSMRHVSLCCFLSAGICAVFAGLVYILLLIVGAAFAFMGLIVRIVRDAFAKAIEMRDELDLTI